MSHITRRMNIIDTLMGDTEHIGEIKANMMQFNAMLNEFNTVQDSYVQMLWEEEKIEDMKTWYQPKMTQIKAFQSKVTKWLATMDKPVSVNDVQVTILDVEKKESLCDEKDEKVSISSRGSSG